MCKCSIFGNVDHEYCLLLSKIDNFEYSINSKYVPHSLEIPNSK